MFELELGSVNFVFVAVFYDTLHVFDKISKHILKDNAHFFVHY